MRYYVTLAVTLILFSACSERSSRQVPVAGTTAEDSTQVVVEATPKAMEAVIEKALLYDNHTLEDTYPYKDTVRRFQWDKIRPILVFIDSIQLKPAKYGILQNRRNVNGEAPLVKSYSRNAYTRIQDEYEVERYQSVPMYEITDTVTPVRYGRDGSLVKILSGREGSNFITVDNVNFEGDWEVPGKYVKAIDIDTPAFLHVAVVDRQNQNIATLEKSGGKWLVRSMNPATTGVHNPPYAQETPLGIFVIQEKKPQMVYLKDGSTATGGFAPWASRFCNGAYIHGVPVNAPGKNPIEFSSTLGTVPRSHMCVRNATSHAKFVYDWAPTLQSLVVVIE